MTNSTLIRHFVSLARAHNRLALTYARLGFDWSTRREHHLRDMAMLSAHQMREDASR
ncbi:MAG TPA: hypothetical protein VD713_02550 [Sphingomonadales bacterium]|nr:hypothetical protein [Sphingomonadales bacterium]